jgi:hypothetical protein
MPSTGDACTLLLLLLPMLLAVEVSALLQSSL